MAPEDGSERVEDMPPIDCDACQSAVDPEGRQDVSFLLLDHLTVPVLSCDDHLDEFAGVCSLTTDDSAELLDHRPAGGITCPACRNARYSATQPMIPVQDGVLALLACPEHQAAIAGRYQSGLETQQQLTSNLTSLEGV